MIQVYGSANPLGPCAQSVPGAGRTAGPAAGAGGPVAAAVGAACSVLQRAECPQPETGGVELPALLRAEVTSSTGDSLIYHMISPTASETLLEG